MPIVPVSPSRSRQQQSATAFQRFAAVNPSFAANLPKLRAYRGRELGKLALLTGALKRDRTRKLLRDKKLALLYAYEAIKGAKQLDRATAASIETLATGCNPFAPSREAVTTFYARSGGRQRRVQNFGPIKRMHQLLVADVLRRLHPPLSNQYLFNGGMPKALAAIEAAFREGCMYAVEVDFIDFYGSIRSDRLAEILHPLPGAVVRHVIWDYTSRRNPDRDFAVPSIGGDPSLTGLVGLSLGAATSPVVGEIIIGLLLARLSFGHEVVTYADNLLVLGRDEAEVMARAELLRESAERLEIGPVRPRVKSPASFRQRDAYVEFASQWGSAIRHRLNWMPDPQKQSEHRIADLTTALTGAQIAVAEQKVIQWRRAYPMWRTGDRWMAERLAELAAARYYQDARPENLIAAQQALLMAYVAAGGTLDLFELLPDGSTAQHRDRRSRLHAETQRLMEAIE